MPLIWPWLAIHQWENISLTTKFSDSPDLSMAILTALDTLKHKDGTCTISPRCAHISWFLFLVGNCIWLPNANYGKKNENGKVFFFLLHSDTNNFFRSLVILIANHPLFIQFRAVALTAWRNPQRHVPPSPWSREEMNCSLLAILLLSCFCPSPKACWIVWEWEWP